MENSSQETEEENKIEPEKVDEADRRMSKESERIDKLWGDNPPFKKTKTLREGKKTASIRTGDGCSEMITFCSSCNKRSFDKLNQT